MSETVEYETHVSDGDYLSNIIYHLQRKTKNTFVISQILQIKFEYRVDKYNENFEMYAIFKIEK